METVAEGDEIFHDRVIPIISRIFKGPGGHIGVDYRRNLGAPIGDGACKYVIGWPGVYCGIQVIL
jgi:hypothetical protein